MLSAVGFRQTTWRTSLVLWLGVLIMGCATSSGPYRLFRGAGWTPASATQVLGQHPTEATVTAFGVVTIRSRRMRWEEPALSISLTIANHSEQPLHLSYVADEYLAQTTDGQKVTLEKSDFFYYPNLLKPGEECSIPLILTGVPLHAVAFILAKLNTAQTTLVLSPSDAPTTLVVPPQTVAADSSILSTAPVQPVSVPVEIEFTQAFGTTLTTQVRWDRTGEWTTLLNHQRAVFTLAPGPHELGLISDLPPVAHTQGAVPVRVSWNEGLRIPIEARAQPLGVGLHAQVWQGKKLVSDQTFLPNPM